MACIYRLALLVLLSLGSFSDVWALSSTVGPNEPAVAAYMARKNNCQTRNPDKTDCLAFRNEYPDQGYTHVIVYYEGDWVVPYISSCPANSTATGATCTCNTSFVENGGACTAPQINNQQNCSDAALSGLSSFGQTRINVKLASGTSMCISNAGNAPGVGCRVDLLDVGVIKLPDGTRIVQGFPRRTNTGADTCPIDSGSTAPKTAGEVEAAPKPCTNGQTGTYNGATVCLPYPPGTSVTTPTKSTTGTTTGTGVDGNTPTSSSASGETTCVTGTCTTTTTTTTTKGDGTSTTSTGTTTQSQGDYCSQNPKSIQCSSGSWGGSCSAGFTCDGDAVQCAVAIEIHKRNCSLYDVADSDEVKAYKAALENPDRDKAGFAQGTVVEKAFQDQIKTDNALGAGASCIGDKQVTVMSATVTIPFSQVCPWLDILGNALVAVGMVAAAVIVFRG